MTQTYSTELIESYKPDGIHARGIGITIKPTKDGSYHVVTRKPGGSRHGTRHYNYSTYEDALERALRWHTVTLPRRSKEKSDQ